MIDDGAIAKTIKTKPIKEVGKQLGIDPSFLTCYGDDKAKLSLELLDKERKGKLVLVTAINPTPAGEGKTTMNIGLSMALNQSGATAISALREPSLGPVFGFKGGATGGGYAQVVPREDINLHFTGDFHAITAAHNLLAAMIDNHIYYGNALGIERVVFERVLDVNDRSLRRIEIQGVRHRFDITAASEIMAILCLAHDFEDLRVRLGRIIVGYTHDNDPVYAKDIEAVGALCVLLKDALKPNLVQTLEKTPALIHGGPFANIAHGCNSIIATKMALNLADYVVTEAGFGADLGAEKFYDIKCRIADLKPDATVLVATIRALKYNGGASLADLKEKNMDALTSGLQHLQQHLENLRLFSDSIVIALNRFDTDDAEELECVEAWGHRVNCQVIPCDVYAQGGKGALELAEAVMALCHEPNTFKPLYEVGDIKETIHQIAAKIYRAEGVTMSEEVVEKIAAIQKLYPEGLPVCIAKTQTSFSDDPKKLGVPRNFTVNVKDVRVSNGAGFVVVLLGPILTMPGLPKKPHAEAMDTDGDEITGLS